MKYEKKGFGYVYQKFMRNPALSVEAKAIFNYLAAFVGDKDECYPSKELMLTELNMSEQRFDKNMKQLTDSGYVIKQRIREYGKFSHNTYKVNAFPDQNSETGKEPYHENPYMEKPHLEIQGMEIQGKENPGMENEGANINSFNINSFNTISINNDIVDTADALPTTQKFSDNSFEILVVETIIHSCLELYPNSKVPSTYKEKEKWALEVGRMKRIDNRSEDEIRQALHFAINDSFWKTNIRSTKKFREKFETLLIQSKQNRNGSKGINKGQQMQDNFIDNVKGWLNDTAGVY